MHRERKILSLTARLDYFVDKIKITKITIKREYCFYFDEKKKEAVK